MSFPSRAGIINDRISLYDAENGGEVMALSNDKIERLVKIATMYYEENKNQSEIASALGISRPLVSRYLTEARDFGNVKIQIQSPI